MPSVSPYDEAETLLSTEDIINPWMDRMPVRERRRHGKVVYDHWRRQDVRGLRNYLIDNLRGSPCPETLFSANGRRQALRMFCDAYREIRMGVIPQNLSKGERKSVMKKLVKLCVNSFGGHVPPLAFLGNVFHETYGTSAPVTSRFTAEGKEKVAPSAFHIADTTLNEHHRVLDLAVLGRKNVSTGSQEQWFQAHVLSEVPTLDLSYKGQRSRWERARGNREPLGLNDLVPNGVLPPDWLRTNEDLTASEIEKLYEFADQQRVNGVPYDLINSLVILEFGIAHARGGQSVRWLHVYDKDDSIATTPFYGFAQRQKLMQDLFNKMEQDHPSFHSSSARDPRITASMSSIEDNLNSFFDKNNLTAKHRERLVTFGRTHGCCVVGCNFHASHMWVRGLEPGIWLPNILAPADEPPSVLCPSHWFQATFITSPLGQDAAVARAVLCDPTAARVIFSVGCCQAPDCGFPPVPLMRNEDPLGLVPGVCDACCRVRKGREAMLSEEARSKGSLVSLSGADELVRDCSVDECPNPAFVGLNPQRSSIWSGLGYVDTEGRPCCRMHFQTKFNGLHWAEAVKKFGHFGVSNRHFNFAAVLQAVSRLNQRSPSTTDDAQKLVVEEARLLAPRMFPQVVPVHMSYLYILRAVADTSVQVTLEWARKLKSEVGRFRTSEPTS